MTDAADLLTGDALLRAMFASSGLGIALVGDDGRPRRSNPALQRMLGYTEDELAAKQFSELMHLDDQLHKRFVRRDGTILRGRLTATLHRSDDTGEVISIYMIEDATEAHAAAEANAALMLDLGERVKELTALHQCAKILLRQDARTDVLFAEVAALLPPAVLHPGATACVRFDGRTHATPGHARSPWMLAHAFATTDGRRGELEIAYHHPHADCGVGLGPYLDEEVRLLESLADMLRGALDRRHAEAAAQQSTDRLNLALTAALMGVWERDVETGVFTWSEHLAQLVGGAAAGAGRLDDYAEMIHPDDRQPIAAFHDGIVDPDRLYAAELRLRRPDGGWRPVATFGRLVPGDRDARPRIVGVVMDLTARYALEAGLRQAQKLEALGQVSGGVAHDFNNLLCVIHGNSELLRAQIPPGPDRVLLDEIRDATARGAALTRQLLAFSRKAEFHPAAVELDALVDRLQPLLRRIVGRAIEVHASLATAGARVWADASQLEQVVMNLVVNARDAMPSGGTVTVATELEGGPDEAPHVAIVVRDTGTGIDPAIVEHLFDPFFTTKEPGKGTGLGLAVVRAVVRQWRGDVSVESAPGRGATFRVRLPVLSS